VLKTCLHAFQCADNSLTFCNLLDVVIAVIVRFIMAPTTSVVGCNGGLLLLLLHLLLTLMLLFFKDNKKEQMLKAFQ